MCGWVGGVPHSLSGAYLQDYASYGYETSWVDRSHQGGVQCTGTITFTCLTFELLPFVYFHTWILFGAYLQNYASYGYEILLVDRSYQGGVQCMGTITLACLIFELLPFVYFHTWILSRAYLQNYTSYGYEILWVDRSHQGGVQGTWTIALVCFFFSYCPLFIFILDFCPVHISKTILAMVTKFYGWIDLIKGECNAHET